MSDRVTERMRLRSHAHIRRLIQNHEQRLRLRAKHPSARVIPCRYLANSPFLQCAVNPLGSCETCPHYQPKDQ